MDLSVRDIWGQLAHLSNYAVLDDECELVAIAEPRKELARQVARRYGVEKVYSNPPPASGKL
ncbi:MAG: hypothetical protein ACOX6S_02175 [Clostridia bacterium]